MKIALIAPPFISVPPRTYGGTELFIAKLAQQLQTLGHKVVLYTNGESTLPVERRWMHEKAQWPIKGEIFDNLKDLNHTAWAIHDAVSSGSDVLHLNNAPGLVCSRFVETPFVYTVHHPQIQGLSDFYRNFPQVAFVAISDFQRKREALQGMRTIHHGIDLRDYAFAGETRAREYLCFLGRIAPIKGTHLAIAVAKQAGIPLKIAGEVQPMFRDYFEREVKPQLDGKNIEYVGEVDLRSKVKLLNGARALLFPIEWEEPFGLVMVEAMACGAPVLAFARGATPEIVEPGVSGYLCRDEAEMAERAKSLDLRPEAVRAYAQQRFSVEAMGKKYADLYAELARTKGSAPAWPAEKGESVA